MRKISCVVVVSVLMCAVAGAGDLRRASPTRQVPEHASGHQQLSALRTPQNSDREEARRRAEAVHACGMT